MRRASLLLIPLIVGACSQPELPPRPSFIEAEDRAHYAAALGEFGLDKAALGREWLGAGEQALADPIIVSLPFRESGYIPPETPTALAYQFDLARGRTLAVDIEFDGGEPSRVFIELFELRDDGEHRQVAEAAPAERQLVYQARSASSYVLRIQPELLRGGRITVVERTLASIGFPVEGLSLRAVQSVFGDPRDGGVRDHHGIDIFAPRGTPVVASADGSVRVDTSARGGKHIWLYPATSAQPATPSNTRRRRGARLYYAHLDGWAVADGDIVRAGEVIGYVGNTGNARTTPPHLHFGVYDRGATDPTPFLYPDDPDPAPIAGSLDLVDGWVRVMTSGATLRESAHSRAGIRAELDLDVVLQVKAATGAYYRVSSPDGSQGYVSVRQVTSALDPIATEEVLQSTDLRTAPGAMGSVIDVIGPAVLVDVLGRFGDYRLVRLADARVGWMALSTDEQRPEL